MFIHAGSLLMPRQNLVLGTPLSLSRWKTHPFWPHAFLAMYAVGSTITFELNVKIYLSEIIAIIAILFMTWRPTVNNYYYLRKIILIYTIWIGAITISDLINESLFFNWAKNAATPLLGAVSLIVCSTALAANPKSLLTFFFFMAASKGLFGEPLYSNDYQGVSINWENIINDINFFKVKIEPAFTPFIIFIACLSVKNNLKFSIFLFTITTVIYFFMDSRSSGLIFFIATLILFLIQYRINFKRRLWVITLATIFVGSLSYVGYISYTLAYNSSGHNGRQLAVMDNPYNPLELVMKGRSEWSVLPLAIAERPVFGWGSWAEDKDARFLTIRAEEATGDAFSLVDVQGSLGYIPAHSVVGSAWLWSGILGFVLMLWLLRTILRMGSLLNFISWPLLPAVAVMFLSVLWGYFFSPSISVRLGFPIALASLIVLTSRAQKPLEKNNHIWPK